MRRDEFRFDLPGELIAQHPAPRRDASRLFVLGAAGTRHLTFADIPELFGPGDLLVLNDTRVRPARLTGRRATGGLFDVLLVRPLGNGRWEALVGGRGKLRDGERLSFGAFEGTVTRAGKTWEVTVPPEADLARLGRMPLPPYIRRARGGDPSDAADRERYQTVYAREEGAIAAPTAGLHFTPEILDRIRAAGAEIACVTLHVGPGTFRPLTAEQVEDHRMEPEPWRIPEATAAAIRRARRVTAAGTTVTRTLEAAWGEGGVRAGEGETALFITPGYRFRVVHRLLTNFHLPEGTPLLLTCAFGGTGRVLAACREAVERRYRFFSYGDAMLLDPG
ncbi:MAG: tRNA preQ1(34) S-adenosylmethionine ribosyltransferase-isomerase QueA [Candidatus Brocadiae bacterium]|nr:tRNA preQ1(34) S-adenosylmethionine ribosyltransferase-isomerase QueA [Candidatus Brocadiia bacterium]